jgi:hypothetical protein
MDIRIDWDDLKIAIPQLIGYGVLIQNKIPPGPPFTFSLSRRLPAKHPKFPWCRCTRILGIRGRLGHKKSGPRMTAFGQGFYGDWDTADVSLLFEAPNYPILEDSEIDAEHQRYVLKTYDSSVEGLARRGENWKFISLAAGTTSFAGDLLLKQPKGILHWRWYNVPENFYLLGKLIPTNFAACVARVNSHYFPEYGWSIDQTDNLTSVQFRPGTLLLLPQKSTPTSQIHPQIGTLGPFVDPSDFPRTYDIDIQWVHFDPPSDDTARVILPDVPGDLPGGTLIRGHNLVPVPVASATQRRWYAAMRAGRAPVATPVPTDQDLLYQYRDMNTLFMSPIPYTPDA